MNITLETRGKTTNYCGAQHISIEEGKVIFFKFHFLDISKNG